MTLSLGNAQHIGERDEQQDAFGFTDAGDASFTAHGGVAAVLCDGMGGTRDGARAAQTAVTVFLDAYRRKRGGEIIADALLRSLGAANEAVLAATAGHGGTTLVAAAVHRGGLHWISSGDSALFLFRQRRIEQVNQPHLYADYLDAEVAAGRMSAQSARDHPERFSLTSHLGIRGIPEVDASGTPLPLEPGDRVVLASDGLFKSLPLSDIAADLNQDPQGATDSLVARTLAAHVPGQDNVTVLCMAVGADMAATRRIAPEQSLWSIARGLWRQLAGR